MTDEAQVTNDTERNSTMTHYTVDRDDRQRWAWSVRWHGGKPICRANTEREAKEIAYALNTREPDRAALCSRRMNTSAP